jgi:hypothetical protein
MVELYVNLDDHTNKIKEESIPKLQENFGTPLFLVLIYYKS